MVRISRTLEYRFVVSGPAISFRSPRATEYKIRVRRAWRRAVPARARFVAPVEVRLNYFHVTQRRFDMDNVAKCVLDALNGIAYIDDQLASVQSAEAHDLTRIVHIHGSPIDIVKPLRDYEEYLFVRVRTA